MLALTLRPGQETIRISTPAGEICLAFERVTHNKTRIHLSAPEACRITRHDSSGAIVGPARPIKPQAEAKMREWSSKLAAELDRPIADPSAGCIIGT